MKKTLLIFTVLLICFSMVKAQTSIVEGTVVDITGKALPGVQISSGTKNVYSNAKGDFSIDGVNYGKSDISFSLSGYSDKIVTVDINAATTKLGFVQLSVSENNSSLNAAGENTITSLEAEDDVKDQYVAGLLHSTNDAFLSVSNYTLSAGYFRPRGYDNEYSEVLIGGLSLNDPETGRPNFSDWGGLNDATRFKESAYGLSPTRFSFGTIAGTSDIDVRASHQRKQVKFSYAFTNRTYRHRAMLTYSTGLMKNNWAVTVSASTRQGNGGYVEGTFYDAFSYFISVEKKINKKHALSFTGFGAPVKRGMQAASFQEVYNLLNDNYYNPNWGLQNGEVRNSRVRNSHEPVLLLSHYYDINDKLKLTTTLGYSFGRTGTTALNWYNAPDPRPDYYRNLPSWQYNMEPTIAPNPQVVNNITEAWQTDINTSQVNWDELYQINYLSYLSGGMSKYIVEERRLNHSQIGLASHLNYEVNNHVFLSGGFDIILYKSRNFKVMNDLLDGNGFEGSWIDVDQFAERDFPSDTNIAQNDLNNPNRIIKKGDVFGYDYDVHINTSKIWALGEFTFNHLDFYVGLALNETQFWREGNMKNGRFPESSFGKSKKYVYYDFAAKIGATYKVTGRHFLVLNAGYINKAPSFGDVFLSPRIKNDVIPDIRVRKILSADLSYIVRYPKFNARLTGFYTNFKDDTKVMSFYHDDLRTYVNYLMIGIDKAHMGVELGFEVKLIPQLSLVAAGSYGDYRYTNRPTAYMSVENGSLSDSVQTIYAKNFFVNGTPQAAGSLGLKYQNQHFWYANINANLFANNWTDFNPSRRTLEALEYVYPGDPRLALITEQTRAFEKPQFTLDISVSKTFRIKDVYLGINASVSNLFNNTNLVTNAYEQLRFDYEGKNVDKFPAKYYYAFGRTFFAMFSLRF